MNEIKRIYSIKVYNLSAMLINCTYIVLVVLTLLQSRTSDPNSVTLLCRLYLFDISIKLLYKLLSSFRNSMNSLNCVIHILTLPYYKNEYFYLQSVFINLLSVITAYMKPKLFLQNDDISESLDKTNVDVSFSDVETKSKCTCINDSSGNKCERVTA
jgi:hypothetical protein